MLGILREKFKEVISTVLPITVIVILLHFFVAPLPQTVFWLFIFGATGLMIGIAVFSLGVDVAMMPMGEMAGSTVAKKKSVPFLLLIGFTIGFIVTAAEPDVHVLAEQASTVPTTLLVMTVAAGAGVMLSIGLFRMVSKFNIKWIFWIAYTIIFILAFFVPEEFLPVAFDAGGASTGPITVPYFLALGIGISSVMGGSEESTDSFGLSGIVSIGPIMAVLVLGLFFKSDGGSYTPYVIPEVGSIAETVMLFLKEIPQTMGEIVFALAPMFLVFLFFQIRYVKLPIRQVWRVMIGLVYSFFGIVIFLVAANVGFIPAGQQLGNIMAAHPIEWIIIPISMLMGFVIIMAEPAVIVLQNQVEELSGGTISKSSIRIALSIGMAFATGFSVIRIMQGVHILWFLIPGYSIALLLTLFTPNTFTAIAFDSGGVASGALAATFLLPFMVGVCERLGGNVTTMAFGAIAMVAMMPLITIQILGILYEKTSQRAKAKQQATRAVLRQEEGFVEWNGEVLTGKENESNAILKAKQEKNVDTSVETNAVGSSEAERVNEDERE